MGNHIVRQEELFAVLCLEINAEEPEIRAAKRMLDILFHADKGFVSKDVCKIVKEKLNDAYAVLCVRNNYNYYCKCLSDNDYEDGHDQCKKLIAFSKRYTKKYIADASEKKRK